MPQGKPILFNRCEGNGLRVVVLLALALRAGQDHGGLEEGPLQEDVLVAQGLVAGVPDLLGRGLGDACVQSGTR